MLPQHE